MTAKGKIMDSNSTEPRARRLRRTFLTLLAACWATAALGQPLAPDPPGLTLSVDDHRPLSVLADELEKRLPVVVTYEEGPWSASKDLQDVTRAVIEANGPKKAAPAVAVIVPRKAAVSFSYPFDLHKARPADYADLLSALLSQYEAAGAPGRFRFEGGDGIYHLIPANLEGKDGKWAAVSPVFSTPVHLADVERTVDATLDEVVAQLNASSPVPVVWGFVPLNLFVRTKVRLSADGVPARQVLRQILESLPRRVTWRLNYDPTTKRYYLSFLPRPGSR